jgi:hypothetical protein
MPSLSRLKKFLLGRDKCFDIHRRRVNLIARKEVIPHGEKAQEGREESSEEGREEGGEEESGQEEGPTLISRSKRCHRLSR